MMNKVERNTLKHVPLIKILSINNLPNNRYLKSVFPTVEEYLLLDVLSNSDNNVQKAADRLVKMGYVKRDTPSKLLFFSYHLGTFDIELKFH